MEETSLQTMPANLIELALKQKAPIGQLEKLLGLQERWDANQAKKTFLSAMSEFQSKCPVLNKSKTVSFGQTKYSYTPLGDISAKIKSVLKDCGLSYRWEINDKAEAIEVTCIVSHLDGHSEKTSMSGQLDKSGSKNEIQQRGSTITYLRRYTLTGALGIATADEDKDGQQPKEKDGKPKLPELNLEHPKWDDAVQSYKDGNVTIVAIRKKYTLSKENETLLCLNAKNLK